MAKLLIRSFDHIAIRVFGPTESNVTFVGDDKTEIKQKIMLFHRYKKITSKFIFKFHLASIDIDSGRNCLFEFNLLPSTVLAVATTDGLPSLTDVLAVT